MSALKREGTGETEEVRKVRRGEKMGDGCLSLRQRRKDAEKGSRSEREKEVCYTCMSMYSVFVCAPVSKKTLFPLALGALVADRTE